MIQLEDLFDMEVISEIFTNNELFIIFLLVNQKITPEEIKERKILDLIEFIQKNQNFIE